MKYTPIIRQHEPSFKDVFPWRELNSMHTTSRLTLLETLSAETVQDKTDFWYCLRENKARFQSWHLRNCTERSERFLGNVIFCSTKNDLKLF